MLVMVQAYMLAPAKPGTTAVLMVRAGHGSGQRSLPRGCSRG